MPYKGIIKQNVVVLEEGATLPDGTPVTVIPEEEAMEYTLRRAQWARFHAGADRIFQRLLYETGMTSDSSEIVRQMRTDRVKR